MAQKVITVAQYKGGSGKTTLAAHLAIAFSQQGRRVAVIDIDPQGSLASWHKQREKWLGKGHTDIDFTSLSGWRLYTTIRKLKEDHDIIIVDTPSHTDSDAKTAMREADIVLIPIQPSPTDLWACARTLEFTQWENVPSYMVLNRVTYNTKIARIIAAKLPNLLENKLGNRVAFASSIMEGKCVTESEPSSRASKEVWALTEEINTLLKGESRVTRLSDYIEKLAKESQPEGLFI